MCEVGMPVRADGMLKGAAIDVMLGMLIIVWAGSGGDISSLGEPNSCASFSRSSSVGTIV